MIQIDIPIPSDFTDDCRKRVTDAIASGSNAVTALQTEFANVWRLAVGEACDRISQLILDRCDVDCVIDNKDTDLPTYVFEQLQVKVKTVPPQAPPAPDVKRLRLVVPLAAITDLLDSHGLTMRSVSVNDSGGYVLNITHKPADFGQDQGSEWYEGRPQSVDGEVPPTIPENGSPDLLGALDAFLRDPAVHQATRRFNDLATLLVRTVRG